MLPRAIFITIPDDWSDASCDLLADRLASDELPEGLRVELCYWTPDEMAWSTLSARESGR